MQARVALSIAAAASVAVAGVCAAALAASTRSYTETRRAGDIEATFSYREKADFGYQDQRLVVRRAGRTALELSLTPADGNWPERPGGSLSLVDLDGGEPEVLVRLFTGGANCCFVWRVYRFAGGRYRGSRFNSGHVGFEVANLDRRGAPEVRSADSRFHYLFSSGADSFYPIRIYRFREGKLVTVTREFPYQIRQAEIYSWRLARRVWRSDRNPHTVLAAWAANKYLLGEGADVWPTIRGLIDRGRIDSRVEVSRRPYPRAVRKALRELGYLALPQKR